MNIHVSSPGNKIFIEVVSHRSEQFDYRKNRLSDADSYDNGIKAF
jgi:hypothetical protein